MADYLYDWQQKRDPLRTRHGLSKADYGCALQSFASKSTIIPNSLKTFAAGVLVGVAGAAWMFMGGMR